MRSVASVEIPRIFLSGSETCGDAPRVGAAPRLVFPDGASRSLSRGMSLEFAPLLCVAYDFDYNETKREGSMRRLSGKSGAPGITMLISAGIVLFNFTPELLAQKASLITVQPELEVFLGNEVISLNALAIQFKNEQNSYQRITPPWADFTLQQDCGLVTFDPTAFPKTFTDGLIGKMEYNCPVYTVIGVEEPSSHKILFLNADGKEIASTDEELGYDPYWMLNEDYPSLYGGSFNQQEIDQLLANYNPARIRIVWKFLPSTFASAYSQAVASAQEAAVNASAISTKAMVGGGSSPMMMYQGPALTNLLLSAIEKMTNGMKLTLAYPWDFTNRVDFFTCPDLIGNWWNLAVDATNVNTSTNWIEWTDMAATAQTFRCYAAGNADLDSDGDGISDAREKYLYHTCPTNSDTDGDGLSDYYEIFVLNTDPNNAKTNKPIVWISYPANESRKVWLP